MTIRIITSFFQFLRIFTQSQMFEMFIQERSKSARLISGGEFEKRLSTAMPNSVLRRLWMCEKDLSEVENEIATGYTFQIFAWHRLYNLFLFFADVVAFFRLAKSLVTKDDHDVPTKAKSEIKKSKKKKTRAFGSALAFTSRQSSPSSKSKRSNSIDSGSTDLLKELKTRQRKQQQLGTTPLHKGHTATVPVTRPTSTFGVPLPNEETTTNSSRKEATQSMYLHKGLSLAALFSGRSSTVYKETNTESAAENT